MKLLLICLLMASPVFAKSRPGKVAKIKVKVKTEKKTQAKEPARILSSEMKPMYSTISSSFLFPVIKVPPKD